jgi:hypothetical protein
MCPERLRPNLTGHAAVDLRCKGSSLRSPDFACNQLTAIRDFADQSTWAWLALDRARLEIAISELRNCMRAVLADESV